MFKYLFSYIRAGLLLRVGAERLYWIRLVLMLIFTSIMWAGIGLDFMGRPLTGIWFDLTTLAMNLAFVLAFGPWIASILFGKAD